MTLKTYNWECECGYSKISDKSPKTCPECLNIDKFEKLELPKEDEDEN